MDEKPSSSSSHGGDAPPARGFAAPTAPLPQQQYPTVAGYPSTDAYPLQYPTQHYPQIPYGQPTVGGALMGQQVMGGAGHDLGVYDGRVFSPDSRQYTTNLFDCTDDMPTCCYGTFCTVCQVGETAQRAKAGDCCATSFILVGLAQLNHVVPFLGSIMAGGFLATTANRAALNYGVTEHTDLITACFCGPCVSCRLAREVKNRAEMGQEPVDVVGQMQAMGGVMAPGGAMMFPAAPVMVRTRAAHPPQQMDGGRGAGGGADTMVTYVAVAQPPPDYRAPPAASSSSSQQQQQQQREEGPLDKL